LAVALVLLPTYAAYIVFSVFGLRAERGEHGHARRAREEPPLTLSASAAARDGAAGPRGLWTAAAMLAIATALTAVASELLVGTIDPVARDVGLSPFFIGLIILPIASNAAEHSSAITVALRDRMEITMAITAGSSIQVALMVAPVLVFVSWVIGVPLDLTFNTLELAIFALAAGLYALVSLDGESTWLEGTQLFAFYLIVAASAFVVRT
jgi:Ca2+:H+ antiporter